METASDQQMFEFQPLEARPVTAGFDGGTIASNAGGLLLREIEAKTRLLADLAACFDDFCDPELLEHTTVDLLCVMPFTFSELESGTGAEFAEEVLDRSIFCNTLLYAPECQQATSYYE
jgi:hypothetical protein